MRPKKKEYTLAALDADGFMIATTLTGAGPTFTTIAGAPGDGLAHQVSVYSSASIATIIFTITGTDANDTVITNTVTGVNNSTVNGTKYFKTVTRVAISATLGANAATVGWLATGVTPAIPVDFSKLTGALVGVYRDGTTVTWTAQGTNVNIFAEPTADDWFTIGTASSTTDIATCAPAGTTAVRALVVSHTNGVLELTVSQARQ